MKRTKKKPSTSAKAKKPSAKKAVAAKKTQTKAKVISLKGRTRPAAKTDQKKAAPISPGEVMRKLLELKEARRKQVAENRSQYHWNEPTRFFEDRNHNVAKFAGPRRRAV